MFRLGPIRVTETKIRPKTTCFMGGFRLLTHVTQLALIPSLNPSPLRREGLQEHERPLQSAVMRPRRGGGRGVGIIRQQRRSPPLFVQTGDVSYSPYAVGSNPLPKSLPTT